jgi:hypothetical protein
MAQRWISIVGLWVIVSGLSLGFGIYAGLLIGPGIRAARGEGIQGLWVAEIPPVARESAWQGSFELPSGKILFSKAAIASVDDSSIHAGSIVPALDEGGRSLIYPRDGYSAKTTVIGFIACVLIFLFAQLGAVLYFLRQRRSGASLRDGLLGLSP